MSGRRDKLNRQLLEAVYRKNVAEIRRLVKQEGADVNWRDGGVRYCLRGQVIVCGKISSILFRMGGLYSSGQRPEIAMML